MAYTPNSAKKDETRLSTTPILCLVFRKSNDVYDMFVHYVQNLARIYTADPTTEHAYCLRCLINGGSK